MEVIRSIRLRDRRLRLRTELTAKLLLFGRKILEVPIGFTRVEWMRARRFDGSTVSCRLYALQSGRLTGGV